ncbi:MAG: site-specific DNA-methyltransferase [Rhodoferax sp.]|uniref:site-specific DNA-methyltransferase n=1 Tax=Rhodoferax sp. TaxID=50421 RepID=UPI003BB1AA45
MTTPTDLLQNLAHLSAPQLRRLLTEHLTKQKLGLYWESSAIERDAALNANVVLPRLSEADSHGLDNIMTTGTPNLIIEGDNFDALRLLKSTHVGKVRVIYIDPPYNTGNKDWVYNDRYVGVNDRWRHSQWLEFLYQRLTLAKDLLTQDGVIMVSINDENRARLELLMDEVLPGRRVGSLVWRTKDTGNDLSQRFSHVHEHVLVYANPGFKFNGRATNRSKFRNPDKDLRGDWSPQPLTANKTLIERKNTYYPIQNPETGYWYPCDPDSVWRFASEQEIRQRFNGDEAAIASALEGLRSDTMESLIAQKLIYFPPCKPEDVMQFDTRAALSAAIAAGTGPMLPKKKTPLLREDLPDIDFWVGKPIAPGRPSRKELWTAKPETERLAPLSSWIAGQNEDVVALEDDNGDEPVVLRSARGGVATEEIKNLLGSKAFPYPKPLSLIQGLINQASRPGDTVLDFFAGSGTTGHAVLALNALEPEAAPRKFILCSSTEATTKEPGKNLCRDVCAARIKKVIASDTVLAHNSFAYLQLDKIAPGDAPFDTNCTQAFQLLTLRLGQVARPVPAVNRGIKILVQNAGDGVLTVMCHKLTRAALDALAALPCRQLRVYSTRPATVREHFSALGREVESLSLARALLHGQLAKRRKKIPPLSGALE